MTTSFPDNCSKVDYNPTWLDTCKRLTAVPGVDIICSTPSPPPTTDPCPNGYKRVNGVCQPIVAPPPTPCTGDDDCQNGTCIGGVCVPTPPPSPVPPPTPTPEPTPGPTPPPTPTPPPVPPEPIVEPEPPIIVDPPLPPTDPLPDGYVWRLKMNLNGYFTKSDDVFCGRCCVSSSTTTVCYEPGSVASPSFIGNTETGDYVGSTVYYMPYILDNDGQQVAYNSNLQITTQAHTTYNGCGDELEVIYTEPYQYLDLVTFDRTWQGVTTQVESGFKFSYPHIQRYGTSSSSPSCASIGFSKVVPLIIFEWEQYRWS